MKQCSSRSPAGRQGKRLVSVQQLVVLAFAAVIVAGAALLMAPVCMRDDKPALGLVDALFTATSAVCVTGLTVRDTGGEFSLAGQIVILLLIQAGGLGILTFSNMLFLLGTRRIGMRGRMAMEETLGVLPSLSLKGVLARVFIFTFVCEGVGAVLLTARFAMDYSLPMALWMGVFHSVSAFCNAGFGLLGTSLVPYSGDLLVNGVVMVLVVLGGLGFIVVEDLRMWLVRRGARRAVRLSLHSRIVLRTTLLLIVVGAALFYVIELPGSAMPGGFAERLMPSLFLSVTCRTAGFNTVDMAQLSNPSLMLCLLLMFIGGSPGSTAGGIKTTTFATLNALLFSRAKNRPKVEMLGRSLPPDVVTKALAATAGAVAMVLLATMVIELLEHSGRSSTESGNAFLAVLFEVVSALGTVGLSVGITADLGAAAKLVLVVCMFVGRLGTILVAYSLVGSVRRVEYTLPEEQIIVG